MEPNPEKAEEKSGFFSFFSSKRAKATAVEFISWVDDEENGLIVKKDLGLYKFTLKYKPLEYEIIRDLKKLEVSEPEFLKVKSEYEGFQYFTFSIARNDGQLDLLKADLNTEQDFTKRVEYFSFQMQQDLRLVSGKDTMNCHLFHFERTYGVSSAANFLIGFENTGSKGDKTLIFDDKILGTGRVKLTIDSDDLAQIPELTF